MNHLTRRNFFLFKCQKQSKSRSNKNFCNTSAVEVEIPLKRGNLKLNFGKLARFADGCCVASIGKTSVMVTAVSKAKSVPTSFVPLLVDYRQKAGAAGRIPTNYLRKELGPTEKEILTSRTIDRSVRPMFPKGFCHETQLSCNLLALDGVHEPDVLSINAASAALSLSDIPWNGPIGAVRVGCIDGELVINPTIKEIKSSSLNLVVAASEKNNIVMLEASAENIPEEDFKNAVNVGVEEAQLIIKQITKLQESHGKAKKTFDETVLPSDELINTAKLILEANVTEVLSNFKLHKVSRGKEIDSLKQESIEKLKENYPDIEINLIYEAVNFVVKDTFRQMVLETDTRCDGRELAELRDITCEINVFEPLHGSALFQRGQTQVLCTVAFDSLDSALRADPVSVLTGGIKEKNFMLHYEFPPFATNEIGKIGAYGRRELGHGNLAERSLRPIIPSALEMTTRLTAEVFESNGSSSMASVCAGSLALIDAGVPILTPVAGIAMGLIALQEDTITNYRILTDILGLEDFMGDMDFKIAGSSSGITAAQLDIKVAGGIPISIIEESLKQALDGRVKILNIMNSVTSTIENKHKKNSPVLEKIEVPVHKVSKLIGPGGLNLKKLTAETGVTLTQIENGVFSVFAPNATAMAEAKEIIDQLLTEEVAPQLEFGAIYAAKIVEIRDSGVMVTLYPSMKPALLPNSQLDQRKVYHPLALGLEVGQDIKVKYFGRDPVNGNMRISRKVIQNLTTSVVKDFIGGNQCTKIES